ncbi:Carotenoid cleavage dioxygenase 8 homolog B, chloroplastic [Linum perenne]
MASMAAFSSTTRSNASSPYTSKKFTHFTNRNSAVVRCCSTGGGGGVFPRKLGRESVVTSAATQVPAFVPAPTPALPAVDDSSDDKNHTAWTSIRQERWEGELTVEGHIPLWLSGTYLRNGPGLWHVGDYNFRHLFDGYATLAKLNFQDGRLIFGHRQIESDAYKAAKKNNKLCYREFSEVPKTDSFLSYIGDMANLFSGASLTDNANTGVVKLGDGRVVCLTETQKGSIVVDPNNLDTIGKFEYTDSLGGLIHSAHPIVTESEFLTLLPDLIRPGYLVVRMEAGSNERKVIGRVDCRGGPSPGWVHSFPVTEHYVVVPEMPLRYCAQNLLKAEPTPLYKFRWIPLDGSPKGELEAALEPEEHGRGMDMCSINPAFLGKKYRYAYACGAQRPCNFPNTLTKIDLMEKKAKNWYDEGTIPSEPFFVARPGATEEDDGVVISMVSEKDGGGYAVLLDGKTFEEIARARFPYGLPYGLHGCWVPN